MRDYKKEIKKRRNSIDKIDARLVKLLNKRVRYVNEIGKFKVQADLKICSPGREKEVLNNVSKNNSGPFSAEAIRRLFRHIIDESRSIECATMVKAKNKKKRSSGC